MNVLFIYDSPLRPESGGTERATKLVMDELSRRGHNGIGILHFNQSNPDKYFFNGSRIESLTQFLENNAVDVVVNQIAFHDWLLRAFLSHGGEEWREKGGKIISFLHFPPRAQPLYLRYWNHFSGFKNKNFIGKCLRIGLLAYKPIIHYRSIKERKRCYRWIYDNSDAYVLLSESFFPEFIRSSKVGDTSKLHVIPNMYTFPNILSRKDLETKSPIVLVVCRMEEKQKHVSLILKIWNKIQNHRGFKLFLVGDGIDLPYYKNYVLHHNIQDVEFKGQQSPLQYYREASIFLMTSRYEGWGLTITESMQNGVVPIVLNTSSVFRDIVTDNNDGYLPQNKKEFQHRLELLLEDTKNRMFMALNALKTVHRFSPASVGEKWEALLNNIFSR